MKDIYVSSGLFTMDLIAVVCSIIVGILAGIIFNAVIGVSVFLIIPAIILTQHISWVKSLKNPK